MGTTEREERRCRVAGEEERERKKCLWPIHNRAQVVGIWGRQRIWESWTGVWVEKRDQQEQPPARRREGLRSEQQERGGENGARGRGGTVVGSGPWRGPRDMLLD